jgi:hypothetical protein
MLHEARGLLGGRKCFYTIAGNCEGHSEHSKNAQRVREDSSVKCSLRAVQWKRRTFLLGKELRRIHPSTSTSYLTHQFDIYTFPCILVFALICSVFFQRSPSHLHTPLLD